MTAVEFMSEEHVAAMNALLEDAAGVREACAALPQPRVLAYRLANGPGGEDVHWAMSFTDTVRFSLQAPSAPDVCFVGDWATMVRTSRASREGDPQDPQLEVEGDAGVIAEVGPAFAAAQALATLPVEFPEV